VLFFLSIEIIIFVLSLSEEKGPSLMNLSSRGDNVRKVLEIFQEAIKREEESSEYYTNASQGIRNAALASLFQSLASDEKDHKKMLELQYEALISRGSKSDLDAPQSMHDDVKSHEEINVAKKAIKVFSEKAEELWKKQVSFEQELAIAGEIQANLLPRSMPNIDDLEISAKAYMSRKVGGDYFDFYVNAKRQLFFVIGDVMGKGIPAALLMTSLRALWRSGALANLSPRKIIEKINTGSVEDFRVNGSFATLFSACYVPVKSSLWYCNAGHDPPFYLQKGRNECFTLTTPGVVVGINPHGTYLQKVQKLSPGDLILFYSDGLWEVTDPERSGLYNRDRVQKLLVENRERPVDEILMLLLAQMQNLSGTSPQRDDVTLVLMRRKA
jgi:serine phosphatase RsbU (regulator of sigma subunit)